MKYVIVLGTYLEGITEVIGPFWTQVEAETYISIDNQNSFSKVIELTNQENYHDY